MKNLLYKEFHLTANPLSYVFILMTLLTLVPGYPILVGIFFVCLGIFYSFQTGREGNDIVFSALLPVAKKDIVNSKYGFVMTIQAASFVLAALLTGGRYLWGQQAEAYVNNPLMNANLVYLGWMLILFALFNVIFVGGYFKTAYNLGRPFIWFSVAAFVLIGIAEAVHFFPGIQWLNNYDPSRLLYRFLFLVFGLVVYVVSSLLAIKKARQRFEQIDL